MHSICRVTVVKKRGIPTLAWPDTYKPMLFTLGLQQKGISSDLPGLLHDLSIAPSPFFSPVQWLQLLVRTGEGWKPVGNEGPFIGLVLPHTAIFLTDAITSECCREWDLMFYFFIHHFTNGFHCKKEIAFVARFFLLRAGGLQALVFIPAGATATLLLTGRNEPGRWEGNQAKFT